MLVGEFVLGSDRRVWGLTLLAVAVYAEVLIAQATMWRLRTLRDIYTMGYRHGRHDANKSLLEAGMWLSDEAERDARRNIGDI